MPFSLVNFISPPKAQKGKPRENRDGMGEGGAQAGGVVALVRVVHGAVPVQVNPGVLQRQMQGIEQLAVVELALARQVQALCKAAGGGRLQLGQLPGGEVLSASRTLRLRAWA